MTFSLQDHEWQLVQNVLLEDLVGLTAALDVLVPADAGRRDLIELCVPRLVALGQREGLPFSKYDKDDLAELPDDHRAAVAAMLSLAPTASPAAMVKAGAKVAKARARNRFGTDPVAYMLPLLLGPVARHAAEIGRGA